MECVICGGTKFGPGPGGRMARSGSAPQCLKCLSLERHRAIRKFFNDIHQPALFSRLNVLQFSKDPAVEESWFKRYEYSIYNGHNSLDLQQIDRPDDYYDLVVCNHVLEHVQHDGRALRELIRIIKKGGIVFLTTPAPISRKCTVDWGYADDRRHGHYREYGADILDLFSAKIPHAQVLQVALQDTVTLVPDVGFILSHGQSDLLRHIQTIAPSMSLADI